jgi:hypothetical protein
MKKIFAFAAFFCILIVAACGSGKEIRSAANDLVFTPLPNGNFVIENSKVRAVISPQFGGRVVSLLNKKTLEETLQPMNNSNISMGGGFYDIVNLVWPGSAEFPYTVKSSGMSQAQDEVFVEVSYSFGENAKDKQGLIINKKFWIDKFASALHSRTELVNLSDKAIDFTYWHQTRPDIGATNENGKTTWLSIEDDIVEIPFSPGSGGHGTTMHPTDGFLGLTAKDSRTTLAWLFDKENIQWYWTWHDVEIPTYDILFKPISLQPMSNQVYPMDLVVLPSDVRALTGGDYKTGIVGYIEPEYKGGSIQLQGEVYKYSGGNLENLKLGIVILDSVNNVVQTLTNMKVETLYAESPLKFSVSAPVSSRVKGGYYKVLLKLQGPDDADLFRSQRYVKMGEIVVPDSGKPLTVNFMWVLHQPIYPTIEESRKNIKQFANIYRNIANLYEKHPGVKSDITFSGSLLWQLVQFYPDIVEQYKSLIDRKVLEMVSTGFGHPLFPFISQEQIQYQVTMDREFKNFLFGQRPKGIHLPEMGFKDGIVEPIVKSDIRWGYFSDIALEKAYRGIPDTDFHIPSRIMSTGFSLDILIRDQAAVNILLKKTDKSIDELVQYILNLEEANTNGDKILVIANNGEFIGNGAYMDKVMARLEKIPWIRFDSGDDILRTSSINQAFLGEKIYGSWYYDLEKQETSFRLWFDTDVKRQIWDELSNCESTVLKINDKIGMASSKAGIDASLPLNLFEDAWEHLLIAEQSDWIWAGNLDSYKISKDQMQDALSTTSLVYDSMMNILQDKKNQIMSIASNGTAVSPEERATLLGKAAVGKFKVWDVQVTPAKITKQSDIDIRFKIYDNQNGIDYNQVSVLYRINDSGPYRQVKARLTFNGSMKAEIGAGKAGDEVEYVILAKDRKDNWSATEKAVFNIADD